MVLNDIAYASQSSLDWIQKCVSVGSSLSLSLCAFVGEIREGWQSVKRTLAYQVRVISY